jgi:hypothetical protein
MSTQESSRIKATAIKESMEKYETQNGLSHLRLFKCDSELSQKKIQIDNSYGTSAYRAGIIGTTPLR